MFSVNDILLNEFQFKCKMNENILNWTVDDVKRFLSDKIESKEILSAVIEEKIDGKTILLLNERDLYSLEAKYNILLGDLKKFSLIVHKIQSQNRSCLVYLGIIDNSQSNLINNLLNGNSQHRSCYQPHHNIIAERSRINDLDISPANSVDGSNSGKCFASCIQPEFFKTVVSLGECDSMIHHFITLILNVHHSLFMAG